MPVVEAEAAQVIGFFESPQVSVSDIVHTGSVEKLRLPRHALVMGHGVQAGEKIFEGKVICREPLPHGTTFFVPKGSSCAYRCDDARHAATVVTLDDDLFLLAARDQIDYDRIEFRLADVTSPMMCSMIQTMRQVSTVEDAGSWPLMVETLSVALTVAAIRGLSPRASTVLERLRGGLDGDRKRRVLQYIDDNLHRPITVAELANVAAMSRYHFMRSFKRAMGESALSYVCGRRLEVAKRLLRTTTDPIAAVAQESGYSSQSHMTTVFKSVLGMTPAKFRRAITMLSASLAPWLETCQTAAKMMMA